MASLTLETVVVRRAEPLTAPVDDDLVMLDPGQSRYYALGSIGRRIWDLLDEPKSVGALCTALEGEYEVPAETCRADVLTFLEQLSDADLVEVR